MSEATRCGIWLSWNNQEEGFELPILPGTIGETVKGAGEGHEVMGLGNINVIKDRELAEYSIESFFPGHSYPFITAEIVFEPKQYVTYIEKWMASKRPIRFVYAKGSNEINKAVSIESFEWKESAGSPGDIEFSLDLKEYRFYGARRAVVVNNSASKKTAPPRADERNKPKTYTMVAGDSLWKVAKKVLGDETKWRDIQKLNGISDSELKRLPIGKVLKLP